MKAQSLWPRVRAKLVARGECMVFTGATNGVGYGKVGFSVSGRVSYRYTHRIAYEAQVGPIPAGLFLDHRCRNRACCNVAHLEPVTNRENALRGTHPNIVAKHAGTCRRGHPVTAENSYRRSDGRLRCRVCARSYR